MITAARTSHLANLVLAGLILAAARAAGAAPITVFNDTFDVGASPTVGNDVDDPNDTAWSVFSVNPGTAALINESGNNVLRKTGHDGFDGVVTGFSAVTLGIGDTLSFSVRARQFSPPTTVNAGLRVSLYQNSGSFDGYVFITNLTNGSTTGTNDGVFDKATGVGNFIATSAKPIDGGDNYQLDNAYRTLSGAIERINATDLRFTFGFDGTDYISGVTVTDATPTFTFGAMAIGITTSQEFRIDDVALTYTPYTAPALPAPAALPAGLALLGVLGARRRRRRHA